MYICIIKHIEHQLTNELEMKNKQLTNGFLKLSLVALLVISFFSANAQHLGKQYEWLKMIPSEIPVASGSPYYELTIKVDGFNKEELEQNAVRFFKNYFSTELYKKEDNDFLGFGNYTISMDPKNIEDNYKVNYIMEIHVRKGRYEIVMRNFTMERFEAQVDLPRRMKAAEEQIPAAQTLCKNFHTRNLIVMKSAYDVMDWKATGDGATASK